MLLFPQPKSYHTRTMYVQKFNYPAIVQRGDNITCTQVVAGRTWQMSTSPANRIRCYSYSIVFWAGDGYMQAVGDWKTVQRLGRVLAQRKKNDAVGYGFRIYHPRRDTRISRQQGQIETFARFYGGEDTARHSRIFRAGQLEPFKVHENLIQTTLADLISDVGAENVEL